MIRGVGVDLVDTRRITTSINRFGERFVKRILADAEMRPALTGQRLAAYVARQFAAKEAVSKALGTGMRRGVHFRNILVLRAESGAPCVRLEGDAALIAREADISDIMISLSDERHYAMAYAVAVDQTSRVSSHPG